MLVANGQKLTCNLFCEGFEWRVQGWQLLVDPHILPLYGYDLILGIQWLSTLGSILWNFEKLKMAFTKGRRTCVLREPRENRLTTINNLQLEKLLVETQQIACKVLGRL